MGEANIPYEKGIDHSLDFLREGYLYIHNRRQSFQSAIFETRLLGQKAICMGGKEAAELFYDENKFKREGAAPNRIKETLFGKKGVQGLDDEEHKHRKDLFMSVMSKDKLKDLQTLTSKQWDMALDKWEGKDEIIFYDEVKEVLCRTAFNWVGITLAEEQVESMTKDLAAMFESPAAFGPAHWKGRHARNKVEKQIEDIITEIRNDQSVVSRESILYQFTFHRNNECDLLDPEVVAVEIINVLRPIVAISIYINFLFLALHQFKEQSLHLKTKDQDYSHMFIQEVRRYYPFFPAVVAIVRKDFVWNDFQFEEGTLTLLDLYGTNHDPHVWDNPDLFDPNRFANNRDIKFELIPQGGGDYFLGHRCAGEWATLEIMKVSLDYLVNNMVYEVPEQDLSYSMVSIPSIPQSKIILQHVKRANSL